MSETTSCRTWLLRFCVSPSGLELGHGGDPIRPDAITVDTNPDTHPSIMGDASNLKWFKDEVFDWVYSSHLLEDFEDTNAVLKEWLRVLRPGGNLVLFLPDQKRYEAHCRVHNVLPNQAHKHAIFDLDYVLGILRQLNVCLVYCESPVTYNPYSFALVIRKVDVDKSLVQ